MGIKIMQDQIADRIDEIADLCEFWKKWRARGYMPTGVRMAIVMLSEEVAALTQCQLDPPQ